MEAEEIGVVLQRASELHSKITDAIERSLKSEFLLSTGAASDVGQSPMQETEENVSVENPSSGYEGNAEARSLGAIRDALETLEEQLECLQTLQQQQRSVKEVALNEIEESRRILLRRLKDHRGKEWEVVHEALAFAGEPVEEGLPLPPYPRPLQDPCSFVDALEGDSPPFRPVPLTFRSDGPVRRLHIAESQDDQNTILTAGEASEVSQGTSPPKSADKEDGNFLGVPLSIANFAGQLLGKVTSKAVVVVASVITILFLSEMRSRHDKRNESSKGSILSSNQSATSTVPKPPSFEERCPPGKVLMVQDGVLKCVVRERIEVPFDKEVKAPDVLYGRG